MSMEKPVWCVSLGYHDYLEIVFTKKETEKGEVGENNSYMLVSILCRSMSASAC